MTRATFDHAQVAVRKGGLTYSHVIVLLKTRTLVSGIWCSWLSHPLSMALSAGGLRFESGFVHFFFGLFFCSRRRNDLQALQDT